MNNWVEEAYPLMKVISKTRLIFNSAAHLNIAWVNTSLSAQTMKPKYKNNWVMYKSPNICSTLSLWFWDVTTIFHLKFAGYSEGSLTIFDLFKQIHEEHPLCSLNGNIDININHFLQEMMLTHNCNIYN